MSTRSHLTQTDLDRLHGVHHVLVDLTFRVNIYWPLRVVYGMRTLAEQRRLFSEGLSKTMNSKHLPQPGGFAWAVDLSPLPIDWDYANGFYYFAGMLQGVARESVPPGWKIRWGGNWDMDFELTDNKFMDLVHFELVKL